MIELRSDVRAYLENGDKQKILYFIRKSITTPCHFIDYKKYSGGEGNTNAEEAGSFETLIAIYIELDDVTSHNTVYSLKAHIYIHENLRQISYTYLYNLALSYFTSPHKHKHYKLEL
jgi:hypothetical protein